MTEVPSYTFAGGVLSRSLWGRYDLNKFQTGLKKAENAVISVEGGVLKRWGSYYLGQRKLSSKAKLIPWRIADNDSYMLEFGDTYVRFIRFGGYVSIPDGYVHNPNNIAANVGGVMEVALPWTASQVGELKYTFANDIMYITHKSTGPWQLRRLGLYDWNAFEQGYDPHPDWSGTVTATYHDDTVPADNYDAEPVPTKYRVSATLSDGIETKPSNVETVNADLGHKRTYVDLNWPDYPDAEQYTIYKGANGIYGFIGYSNNSDFTDRNYAPSYEVVPLGKSIPMGNPTVMEFYKQRMVYAATAASTQDLWFSRPFILNSLRKSVPLQDDDAFNISLVGRERHTINHMLMLKKFIIFTDSAEWTLNTVENRALSAATVDPVIETYYGAHPILRPLSVGNRILFVQNKTGAILDMGYEYTSDAFKADDLSRLSRDLFKGKSIVAWDYAVHPQSLLYCVLDDGTINVMTYVREHEIWGWSTFKTDGIITDVACVTEIDREVAYIQVTRVINGVTKYYVERFEVNFDDTLENMIYTDCSITYTQSETTTLTYIDADTLQLEKNSLTFSVGDEVRMEINGLRFYGTVTLEDTLYYELTPLQPTAAFLPEHAGEALCYQMTATVTGLSHLEGKSVWVLADGRAYKDLTVTSGTITLDRTAAKIHVGLPYTTRIETLDIDPAPARGFFHQKTVHEITLNLMNSRGVYVGSDNPDYDLDKALERNSETNMFDANGLLNGAVKLRPHISWGDTTEVVIESRDPLPLNILNITPDVRYGS